MSTFLIFAVTRSTVGSRGKFNGWTFGKIARNLVIRGEDQNYRQSDLEVDGPVGTS